MTNKKILIALVVAVTASSSLALFVKEYRDWPTVQNESPAIIIAKCKDTPEWMRYTNGVLHMNPSFGLVAADMEIVTVLKGTNTPSGTIMTLGSEFWPRQGESYLIMADNYDGTTCLATEKYRVIPLGLFFTTNALTGKTVDEKIKQMLQFRLNHVNREIAESQIEKQRLEAALKK